MNLLQKVLVGLVRLFIAILWFFDKTFAFSFYAIFLVVFFGTAAVLVSYNSSYIHNFADSLVELKIGNTPENLSDVTPFGLANMPGQIFFSSKPVFDKEFFERNKDLLPKVLSSHYR